MNTRLSSANIQEGYSLSALVQSEHVQKAEVVLYRIGMVHKHENG